MKARRVFSLSFCIGLAWAAALACQAEDDSNSTELLGLTAWYLAATAEEVADIYPQTGFPGSSVTVNSESSSSASVSARSFSGSASEYAVTVNGVAASGVSLPSSTSLQFTMPEVPSLTDNATVPLRITRGGNVVLEKTIRYRPAPTLTINQPNAFVRRVSGVDTKSYFKVEVTSSGAHLFNVFGYAGADLNIYYYTSATSSATELATGAGLDAEFNRTSLSAGTYFLEVRYVSGGFPTFYKINAANGVITPNSTFNEYASFQRCYDFLGSGAAANPAGGCANVNSGTFKTGYCTYPTNTGIATRHYYLICDASFQCQGFNPTYAEQTCTQPGFDSPNPAFAIFTSA